MAKEDMQWLRLTAIGTHFVAGMGIGFYIGRYWVDAALGTDPIFTVFLSLCGIAAGFLNLYRELQILNKQDKEAKSGESADDETPS